MEKETQQLLNAVQEEKNRLSALLNSIQDEVWFADTEKRFTLINASALQEFGLDVSNDEITVEELARSLEVYRPDGSPRPVDEAPPLRALRGEALRNQEEIIRTPARGDLRHREVSSAPVRDRGGTVIGSLSVVRDITERKRMEQELRQSERLYRAIGESINYGVWVCAPDGRNIYASESFLKMVGLTQEECSSFGWGNVLHPDDAERTIAAWQECVRTEGIWDIEHRYRGVDGQYHYVLARGIPVRNDQGQITCWAGINLDIDHLKQMQEDLRRSRDDLELRVQERTAQLRRQAELLDLAHDAVILSDTEGRIAFWNKGAEDTYGFTREEATGKFVQELLQAKSDIPLKDIVDRVNREGRWEGELVHTCKEGKEVTVHSRWALRHDEVTGSAEIMEVNRDITVRKRAEEALRVMGEYNRSLIDASVDPLVTIDPEGRVSDVNIATERVTGYPRERLIGTDFSNYFTDPEKAKAVYEQVFREGIVRDYALEIRHRDGHRTPVLYNASVYKDEAGAVIGVFAAARDITERKRAEAALKESEETARARLMEIETYYSMTPIGLCILDKEFRYLTVNERLAEINGLPVSAHLGRTIREVAPAVADLAEETARRIIKTGESISNIEFTAETAERPGIKRTFRATWFPFKDTHEQVTRVGAMVEEITEQCRLEEQLRQAQKMEAIGTLAGGIAHDFNNILAAIIGFAEMVEEDLPQGSPSIRHVQRVLNAASRGRDLVRQILAFSRKTELTSRPLRLSPLVEETVQLLRASLPTTIQINVSIKAGRETILASPAEVQQILMNLATNAGRAMREKGGILSIILTDTDFEPDSPVTDPVTEPEKYVALVVKDTGVGMSPDVMARIFEPFFTTDGVGEGTGMGLAVVYGIVKSLRGTITVESEPGIGSTFRVFLPVAPTDGESEGRKVQEAPTGTEHILFVDDEDLLVEWGQAALERLGYTVTVLTDSTEALSLFSSDPSRFDLVITDQTMPKLTGLQLARNLLTIRSNIPIILCTGHSDSVSPQKVKEAGIKEFLMKPLGKQALGEAIRKVLHKTAFR